MGLYDKFANLAERLDEYRTPGLNPFGACIDEIYSATEGRIGEHKIVLAGTNNYLGLTFNEQAIAEGQAALAAQVPVPPALVWLTVVTVRTLL